MSNPPIVTEVVARLRFAIDQAEVSDGQIREMWTCLAFGLARSLARVLESPGPDSEGLARAGMATHDLICSGHSERNAEVAARMSVAFDDDTVSRVDRYQNVVDAKNRGVGN